VVIACRDEDVARQRFGVIGEGAGICYTRTGRRFFDDPAVERELVGVVRGVLGRTGFWEKHRTDWVCLDCELMPWSAKAQELIRQQYAAVGAAAGGALPQVVDALQSAARRDIDVTTLLERYQERRDLVTRFVESYRHYCWPVESVKDLKLAPFHVLATEGTVHVDKDHLWHMQTLADLATADGEVLIATPNRVVDLTDPASEAEATSWWEELTGRGGEGMVVKPLSFIAKGRRGLVQPAVKDASICASSTGRSTRSRRTWTGCGGGGFRSSARSPCGNSPSGSKDWSGSSARSRSVECKSVCSGCWRWRASPWTRGCRADEH